MKSGPIIVIEDDADDQEMFEEVVRKLEHKNRIVFFDNCIDAWNYLKNTTEQPLIIFSDVNLPRQSGIEFKKRIDEDTYMRRKSIPFIFYSTSVDQTVVNLAYTTLNVQGFFKKGNNMEEIKENLRIILEYWKTSRHPNT
jgi:CheY-like chemotaxis protein